MSTEIIKAQIKLEGEDARLWRLLKNKKNFVEAILKRTYKDDNLKDLFFNDVPNEVKEKPAVERKLAKDDDIIIPPLTPKNSSKEW